MYFTYDRIRDKLISLSFYIKTTPWTKSRPKITPIFLAICLRGIEIPNFYYCKKQHKWNSTFINSSRIVTFVKKTSWLRLGLAYLCRSIHLHMQFTIQNHPGESFHLVFTRKWKPIQIRAKMTPIFLANCMGGIDFFNFSYCKLQHKWNSTFINSSRIVTFVKKTSWSGLGLAYFRRSINLHM